MNLKEILIRNYYNRKGYKNAVAITPAVLKSEIDEIRETLLTLESYNEKQYSKLIDVLVALQRFKEAIIVRNKNGR